MTFKKLLALMLIVAMIMVTTACGAKTETSETSGTLESEGGTFIGEADGKNGPIKVEVTIEKGEITGIEIIENHESDFTKTTFDEILATIIAQNTADVDVITGATMTSEAIISAVSDALSKSGITLVAKQANAENTVFTDTEADIVIIGAGGAGLTAAIEATKKGAKVIVVEKNSFMGGNTNYATGGMNAANTKLQAEKGVVDSAELFYEDTLKGGHNLNDPVLLKKLTEESSNAIDWLTEIGASLTKLSRSGGQSVDRTHTTADGSPIGSYLMSVFEKNIVDLGIEVRLNTKATEIIAKDNQAAGIVVETNDGQTYSIHAKAVIIASGGFGANQELVVQYKPELEGFGTTNHPGATGDAFYMLDALKVATVDMEQIQTHPTVVPVKNEMITEGVRGEGALLVNREAVRFINELETRDVVSKAILAQEGKTAFLILDSGVEERLASVSKYKKMGLLTEGATIAELAEKLGLDPVVLEETVTSYNTYFKNQNDEEFGRRVLAGEIAKGPFYAVEVAPAIHHTMGGIKINDQAQVLNTSSEVVPGLFAAGEVTGGIHGGNRIGGNAVADIVVFGRIAGSSAADYIQK
ncbi:MAG: flavocytochrome c [Firmicutes bacterium]|nr:flavocytochrome c [Bacillota bacterium]